MQRIIFRTKDESVKARRQLAEMFGVQTPFICLALNFKRDSLLAKRVRKTAIDQLNGILLSDNMQTDRKPVKELDTAGNIIKII